MEAAAVYDHTFSCCDFSEPDQRPTFEGPLHSVPSVLESLSSLTLQTMKNSFFIASALLCLALGVHALSPSVMTSSGPVVGAQEANYFVWKGMPFYAPLLPRFCC